MVSVIIYWKFVEEWYVNMSQMLNYLGVVSYSIKGTHVWCTSSEDFWSTTSDAWACLLYAFFQSLLLLSKPYFLVKSLVMRLTRMHTVPKSDYVCSCKPDQWCYTHTQNNDGIYTMCARVKSFFFFLNHCDATQAWMRNSSFPLFPFNQSKAWSYTTEALLYFMWQFSKLYRFTESPHRHSCKGQWWD